MGGAAFRSGDALMSFGADLRIQSWNEELERLTGIPAEEAVGRSCWEMLGGIDEQGGLICHIGCSAARLARQGWPIPSRKILIKGPDGRQLVSMSTIVAVNEAGPPVCLHLFRNGAPVEVDEAPADEVQLTPRQREVLTQLSDGAPAKVIAGRLGITEVTVRNHIRGILMELGCHSQLEAVAEARRRRLV